MNKAQRKAPGKYEATHFGIFSEGDTPHRKQWKILPLTFPGRVVLPDKPGTMLTLRAAQQAVLVYESWAAAWVLAHCRTVKRSALSTIHMVTGKEPHYPTVILDNRIQDWVAIGWIDLREATEEDYDTFPVVVE